MSDTCTIIINGETYFFPTDKIIYLNSDGIYTGSGSVNAYKSIDTDTRGEYIVFDSFRQPYLYRSYNSRQYITVESLEFNSYAQYIRQKPYIDLFVSFTIILFIVLNIFRGGR